MAALQGGAGARLPVTPAECAIACTAAPGCDMFTYNAVQQGCFLKAGQCPLRNDCQVGLSWQQPIPLTWLLPWPGRHLDGLSLHGSARHLRSVPCPTHAVQPPELTCWSVSDTGKNLTTPCGTWWEGRAAP